MAKAPTAEPGERLEDAAERSQSPAGPVCLDEVLERGAVYKGRPVGRIEFQFDGGELKLELDATIEVEPELTPKQAAILTVIDEMKVGEVLGYEGIAAKAGYSASMDLREFVQQLAMAGRLRKERQGWKRVR